jgi:hypothetical protein
VSAQLSAQVRAQRAFGKRLNRDFQQLSPKRRQAPRPDG